MTLNFETLKATLVLYGLNAVCATVLLIVGWYASGFAQGFVSRVLTATHRVDALVTVFLSSLARYAVLAVVGIAVLQLFGIQTGKPGGSTGRDVARNRPRTARNAVEPRRRRPGVMLLLFRPFRIGDDVEVAGRVGKVRAVSLFMTELVALDNTQILLPNGSVWGSAIINHSTYPGTGEMSVSFPVRAGRPVERIREQIRKHLQDDPRIESQPPPDAHVSKVVDISNATSPVVELTVSARTKPADVEAVKQRVLDEVSAALSDDAEPPKTTRITSQGTPVPLRG